MTAHAEQLLASWASRAYGAAFLSGCRLHSQVEPRAICAGALYRAGIGCLVHSQCEADLEAMTGARAENPTLALACRVVLVGGQRAVEVIGPPPEEEAGWLRKNSGKTGRAGACATAVDRQAGARRTAHHAAAHAQISSLRSLCA